MQRSYPPAYRKGLSMIGKLHEKLAMGRRAGALATHFAGLIPQGGHVLDVGCGDGKIGALLREKRPDVEIHGIDVQRREGTQIPVDRFDGRHIPFESGAFDLVMFSDVLHHTEDPLILQKEAQRVAKRWVLIKDHFRDGFAAGVRLRFMDWVGNARFGVALPYNYWTERQWREAWTALGLREEEMITKLGLYPGPADWLFGADLHFIALLTKT